MGWYASGDVGGYARKRGAKGEIDRRNFIFDDIS
jgi:hypothetical protein